MLTYEDVELEKSSSDSSHEVSRSKYPNSSPLKRCLPNRRGVFQPAFFRGFRCQTGVIKLPFFWGDPTMQINGEFEGLTLFSYFLCMKFGLVIQWPLLNLLYHAFTTGDGFFQGLVGKWRWLRWFDQIAQSWNARKRWHNQNWVKYFLKKIVSTRSNDSVFSFFFEFLCRFLGEMIQFDEDCFSNGWLNTTYW